MSKDWRVAFARVMDRCAGYPAARKDVRIRRRRTGRGPAGPSELAMKRARRKGVGVSKDQPIDDPQCQHTVCPTCGRCTKCEGHGYPCNQ